MTPDEIARLDIPLLKDLPGEDLEAFCAALRP